MWSMGFVILSEAFGQFIKHWNITFPNLKVFLQGKQLISISNEPSREISSDDFNKNFWRLETI